MKNLIISAVIFSATLLSGPAYASPITVSAGNPVTFNFSFAAALPLINPPYDSVTFFSGLFTPLNPSNSYGNWAFYTDIDHGGGSAGGSPAETLTSIVLNNSGVTGDGLFSATLSVTQGTLTVNPYAIGERGGSDTDQIIPTIMANGQGTGTVGVPEPATLTLFAIGLAGLGWARRQVD